MCKRNCRIAQSLLHRCKHNGRLKFGDEARNTGYLYYCNRLPTHCCRPGRRYVNYQQVPHCPFVAKARPHGLPCLSHSAHNRRVKQVFSYVKWKALANKLLNALTLNEKKIKISRRQIYLKRLMYKLRNQLSDYGKQGRTRFLKHSA